MLADQLLFLSRQDAGLGSKVNESVQLEALLQEVVTNMQLMAQEKGITLELPDCPLCELSTDARLLRRVFVNLLDNAIKYTGQAGRVVLSCDVAAEEVTIQIRDSGVGISPEHLPHIFERFYRVDAARSGDGNGAGLGLAICQAILRNLDGTISVHSEVGKGTTFTVTLPRS